MRLQEPWVSRDWGVLGVLPAELQLLWQPVGAGRSRVAEGSQGGFLVCTGKMCWDSFREKEPTSRECAEGRFSQPSEDDAHREKTNLGFTNCNIGENRHTWGQILLL